MKPWSTLTRLQNGRKTRTTSLTQETVKVRVEDFNKVIEEFNPSMIVCDIEGAELDLIRNAKLNNVDRFYVELHQRALNRAGMKEIFDEFSKRDFHYDSPHSGDGVVLFSHIDRR